MFLEKLLMHARIQPEADAIVHATGRISYRVLVPTVREAASALLAAGVSPGDVVGLAIADEAGHLVASLALLALGTRQITIAAHDSLAEIDYLSRQAGVSLMLTERGRSYPGLPCLPWPPAPAPEGQVLALSPTEAGVIFSTSGTTGARRLVCVSEAQLAQQASRHPEYATERLLRLASIEFNNSKRHRLYCTWLGGTNVFGGDGSAEQTIAFVLDNRITSLDVSRMHLVDIARAPGASKLANVKIRPGGGPVPKSVRALVMDAVSPQLYVRYATTETGALAMTSLDDEASDDLCGLPLPGVVVQILNVDDQVCGPNEVGVVRVKASGMADRYLNSEPFSGKGWHEGWFYPGDLGWMDDRGRLHVQGRADDLINLNGIKISPDEIEAALAAEAGVRCAAAFGLPSAVHGQLPVAVLEADDAQAISLETLLAKMRERLGVRAPRKLRVVAAIPRSQQGKILRRDLPALWRDMDLHGQ